MKFIIFFILLMIIIVNQKAIAGEAECLSNIMFAEAKGQSIEGVVAIGQASISKARIEKTEICKLKGVHRNNPNTAMKEHFRTLAEGMLREISTKVSLGADHWNKGKRPYLPGKVTRQIGEHVFYVMKVD